MIEIRFAKLSVAHPRSTLRCQHLGGVAPRVDVACELLLRIELLVLTLCPPLGDQTGDDCQSASSDDDTAASLVSWLLRSQEEVGSEPMGNLQTLLELNTKRGVGGRTYTADTVGNRDKRSSLGTRSGHDCGLPGNLNVQADEGARAKQEDREVSGSDVECGDHNDGTNQRD